MSFLKIFYKFGGSLSGTSPQASKYFFGSIELLPLEFWMVVAYLVRSPSEEGVIPNRPQQSRALLSHFFQKSKFCKKNSNSFSCTQVSAFSIILCTDISSNNRTNDTNIIKTLLRIMILLCFRTQEIIYSIEKLSRQQQLLLWFYNDCKKYYYFFVATYSLYEDFRIFVQS